MVTMHRVHALTTSNPWGKQVQYYSRDKKQARAVEEGGEKCPLCDPGVKLQ